MWPFLLYVTNEIGFEVDTIAKQYTCHSVNKKKKKNHLSFKNQIALKKDDFVLKLD